MLRSVLGAALIAALPLSAMADSFVSVLVSFDPATKTLVMADATVWDLNDDFVLPAGLSVGDSLQITYGAESGVSAILRVGPDGQPLSAATGG